MSTSSLASFDSNKRLRRNLGLDNGVHNVPQLLQATKTLAASFVVCGGSEVEQAMVSRASEFVSRVHRMFI